VNAIDSAFDTSALKPKRQPDYRLAIAIALTILLALYFWTQSRYPALGAKAEMGEDTPLSGLAFDIAIEVQPGDGFWKVLWANTINWIVTNIKGMTFGVMFGAMALTVLSLLQKRSFKNGFANSALGTVIGAPLGVCVNCAAPIALGLHAGRLRLETTLSAMLSSPTLNVIVVTMSFALLPVHVAAAKLAASLGMVLIGVPLLCRYLLKEEAARTHAGATNLPKGPELTGLSGWLMRNLAPREYVGGRFGPLQSLLWFARNYGRNFGYVFIVTVPMMFLAAVLGALFIEFFSPTELAMILPLQGEVWIFLGIVAVALIASFAPAPIALDVILTAIVVGLGMRDHYAAALVVSLGSFSVYAFLIVWRAVSLRTAVAVWLMVVGAATGAGCLASLLDGPATRYKIDGYQRLLRESGGIAWPQIETPQALGTGNPAPAIAARALGFTQSGDAPVAGIELRPFNSQAAPAASGPVFTRVVGDTIGLDLHDRVTGLQRFLAYGIAGGIAAGDFDDDGWTDLALRQSMFAGGFGLFRNEGGNFARYPLDLGDFATLPALNVAFADLDGNAKLDLVVSTDGKGSYILFNRGNRFSMDASVKLPGDDMIRTRAMAFADFDGDGRLDIVLGNDGISMRTAGFIDKSVNATHNRLLLNRGDGKFDQRRVSLFPGQTLTLLASDFDRNGTIDLLAGDDVANTDGFVLFDGKGGFAFARGAVRPFPYRTTSSMGYEEGDWNNDLVPDYYGVQVTGLDHNSPGAHRSDKLAEVCQQIGSDSGWPAQEVRACRNRLASYSVLKEAYRSGLQSSCDTSRDPQVRQLCAAQAMFHYYQSRRTDRPDRARYEECMDAVQKLPRLEMVCQSLLLTLRPRPSNKEYERELGPNVTQANVLFTGKADGSFADDAEAQGVRLPGWSWDSKFADLDQDGWQDLLVLTGWWGRAPDSQTNRFYHNAGGRFEDRTEAFGLYDILPSFSSVRLDYDRDGDVDIVRALSGPNIIVHRNDRPAGKALWVYLRQEGGNAAAVGARVTICTGGATAVEKGKCQVRPIKASGGFESFDPIAAHFGLGKAGEVSLIEVRWPDGKRTLLTPSALDGGEIIIRRAGA